MFKMVQAWDLCCYGKLLVFKGLLASVDVL